jgi:hypothetical protein
VVDVGQCAVPGVPPTVTGNTVTPVLANISGLLPGNTCHYRVNGTNSNGTTNGIDMIFITLPILPAVITTPATGVGATTATVSANITGLNLNTTCHFRIQAVNSVGTSNGSDLSFTTTNCPLPGAPGAISGPTSGCGNTTGNGTISPDFSVTVNPVPPAPVITLSGDTLMSDAPAGNQWYFEGNEIPGANGQFYIPTQSGNYTCTVTLTGCTSTASNQIYVIITSLTEQLRALTLSIYPNPNSGRFTLKIISPSDQMIDLNIINSLGLSVYEKKDINVNGILMEHLDLSSLPSGMYMIRLIYDKSHVTTKVMIE